MPSHPVFCSDTVDNSSLITMKLMLTSSISLWKHPRTITHLDCVELSFQTGGSLLQLAGSETRASLGGPEQAVCLEPTAGGFDSLLLPSMPPS
jgi:hypothetical protein